MKLLPLPAFTDNYIWMLHDGTHAVVVDPGDATPVQHALQSLGLTLQVILVTHHHADHVGGVGVLQQQTGRPSTAPQPRNHAPTHRAHRRPAGTRAGSRPAGAGRAGHTAGHIAYYCADSPKRPLAVLRRYAVLRRLWPPVEGTPAQMHELAADTRGVATPHPGVLCP